MKGSTEKTSTIETLSRLCAEGSAVVFDIPDENYFTASEARVQKTVALAAGFFFFPRR